MKTQWGRNHQIIMKALDHIYDNATNAKETSQGRRTKRTKPKYTARRAGTVHSDTKTGRPIFMTSGSHWEDIVASNPEEQEKLMVIDLTPDPELRGALAFRVLVSAMALPSYDAPIWELETNRSWPGAAVQGSYTDGLPEAIRISITALLQRPGELCDQCPQAGTQFKKQCYTDGGTDLRLATKAESRAILAAATGGDEGLPGYWCQVERGRAGPRECSIVNSTYAYHRGPGRAVCSNTSCKAWRDLLFACVTDSTWRKNGAPDKLASDNDVIWEGMKLDEYPEGRDWTRPALQVKVGDSEQLDLTCTEGEGCHTNTCLEVKNANKDVSVDSSYQFETASTYDRLHLVRISLASGAIYISDINGNFALRARWDWSMPPYAGPEEDKQDLVVCALGGDYFLPTHFAGHATPPTHRAGAVRSQSEFVARAG